MIIKKLLVVFLASVMMLSMAAYGAESTESEEATPEDTVVDEKADSESGQNADVLVVYFSATGTTKGIAEKIASIEGADLYEIVPVQEYTDDDRNWHDENSRTTIEQNDPSVRPEIANNDLDLAGYSKIYIGYPIWWGQEPRIMDTFVESHDFGSITVIPFCTSGSSGIGESGNNLRNNAGSGNWLEGERFAADTTEDVLREWIDRLKYDQ